MVKYEYRPELEMFKRVDNRGYPLKFNIVEGRRIESMLKMGLKVPTIYSKIDFVNDVSITNLRTFVDNLKKGNIDLTGDYPSPVYQVKEIALEERISKLEEEFEEFKKRMNDPSPSEGIGNKVKEWLRS